MNKRGYTLRDSLLHLRACRPIAFPNIGFLVQLKAYESTVFGKCSDVPLRLEKLFGIPLEQLKKESEDSEEEKKTEEDKSELKAIKDAEQQLELKKKLEAEKAEVEAESKKVNQMPSNENVEF